MRRISLLAAFIGSVTACVSVARTPQKEEIQGRLLLTLPPLGELLDVPVPNSMYSDEVKKAREEITLENAPSVLQKMLEEIEKERIR